MNPILLRGWGNDGGPTGYGFGVYYENVAHPLDPTSPVHELLSQAAHLLASGAREGVLCGQKAQTSLDAQGRRQVALQTAWAYVVLRENTERPGNFVLSIELPFGHRGAQ